METFFAGYCTCYTRGLSEPRVHVNAHAQEYACVSVSVRVRVISAHTHDEELIAHSPMRAFRSRNFLYLFNGPSRSSFCQINPLFACISVTLLLL